MLRRKFLGFLLMLPLALIRPLKSLANNKKEFEHNPDHLYFHLTVNYKGRKLHSPGMVLYDFGKRELSESELEAIKHFFKITNRNAVLLIEQFHRGMMNISQGKYFELRQKDLEAKGLNWKWEIQL